ncbi:hypothetical protein KS4_02690 [Poriferisphaera corsica]|uniref:Uncharacterized protein n=1 Tax=Poriferisphaera corsica TaxID=2528020 RepID=A0A517YPV7_9BACT|nr:hypothetical protein [Poriferisphaera corsica]QDU32238.1 hypothetical protein KS4_02690 [Poriferisphaera corsica]
MTGNGSDSSGDIYVGDYGEIEVSNIRLQLAAGNESHMTVDGENASVLVRNGLVVGNAGNANFTIREGTVTATNLLFVDNDFARGHVTIIDKDSELVVHNEVNMGVNNNARLDLYHNGKLNVNGTLFTNYASTINIFGGQLTSNNLFLEPDTSPINWQTGSIILNSDQAIYEGSTLDVLTYDDESTSSTSFNKLGVGKILFINGEFSMSKQLTIDGGTLIVDQFDSHGGLPLLDLRKGSFGFYHTDTLGDNSPLGSHLMMNEDMKIIAGSTLTNTGWIGGSGLITDQIPSNLPTNPTTSLFINEAVGVIHLDDDNHLFIDMDGAVNNGTIEIYDSRLTFDGSLLNYGDITGLNTYFRASSIDNYGEMNYADTQHVIFGDITNNIDGSITVTRDARLTIQDDFDNQSELRISHDASVVIFGQFSGTGSITGGGTTYIEGELTPGNSPGLINVDGDVVLSDNATAQMELAGTTIGSEYDALDINGDLTLDGILEILLLDGFNPLLSQTFQLFSATNFQGQFEQLLLPNLTSNLDWDTTQLNSQGVLRIIPEPTTALTLSALLCIFNKRRRMV